MNNKRNGPARKEQKEENNATCWKKRRGRKKKKKTRNKNNPTTEKRKKDPTVHETSLVVTLCALSQPSSPDIEKFKPHRRTILIPLLTAPTSHKRPSRK